MAVRRIAHPSVDDRRARGKQAQDRTPLSSHTGWTPATDRPDPVALLEEQDATREPDLVPVASVAAYREAMAGFAAMGTMDIWYAHLDEDELLKGIRAAAKAPRKGKEAKAAKRARKTAEMSLAKAHTRDSQQALSKL